VDSSVFHQQPGRPHRAKRQAGWWTGGAWRGNRIKSVLPLAQSSWWRPARTADLVAQQHDQRGTKGATFLHTCECDQSSGMIVISEEYTIFFFLPIDWFT
jgi:hypothetical protein